MSRAWLTGVLEFIRLPSVVQMLLGDGIHGRLEVSTPRGNGWILLHGGMLIDASYSGLSGAEAVIALLMSQAGEYRLLGTDDVSSPVIQMDSFSLLVESLRVQDHWEALAGRSLVPLEADADDTALTRALRSGVCVEDAALMAGLHAVQALPLVEELLNGGRWRQGPRVLRRVDHSSQTAAPTLPVVEPTAPPPAPVVSAPTAPQVSAAVQPPPPVEPARPSAPREEPSSPEQKRQEFNRHMELGFAAFKSGNLDVAEQHWRQAENIFPQDVRIQMNLRVLALRKQRER